jgi:hypothetical protein
MLWILVDDGCRVQGELEEASLRRVCDDHAEVNVAGLSGGP